MKKIISYISVAVLFSLISVFQGCDFGDIKSKSTTGELSFSADENFEPLVKVFKSEFERLNKEAKLNCTFAPTKAAIADLINGKTKYIIIGRELDSAENRVKDSNKTKVQKFEIAVDGIAFIVNPENPVSRVTSNDLKKIFTGEYTEWSQVKVDIEEQDKAVSKLKGSKNKIKLFIQRPNSAMYSYVIDTVLAGMEYSQAAQICSTSVQMLDLVRSNENSVGISNSAWLSTGNQEKLDSTLKVLRISRIYPGGRQDDFTEFHQGLIYTKKYPYRRSVYVYSTEFDIQLATGFTTFILNADGQKQVVNFGLVPVHQPVRTIQLN